MQKKKQNWWNITNDEVRKEVANIEKPKNNSHVANKTRCKHMSLQQIDDDKWRWTRCK
jgi:hypothetical protein